MSKNENTDESHLPDSQEYEKEHVHSVYDQIAPHFSATRYKPWPLISTFLSNLPLGSVGLDVGCGNGKYLGINPGVFIVASDTSLPLLQIAQQHFQTGAPNSARAASTSLTRAACLRNEVIQASAISLPHPSGQFDFAISIAVIHHLSTRDRRIEAVRSILETLRPWNTVKDKVTAGNSTKKKVQELEDDQAKVARLSRSERGGKCLIFVWALEQKSSRRGWDEGDKQDVMVPWVLKKGESDSGKGAKQERRTMTGAGKQEEETGEYAKSCASCGESNGPLDDRTVESKTRGVNREEVCYRYYHLYKKGELEQDVEAAGGLVLGGGWEKDNWWAVAARDRG